MLSATDNVETGHVEKVIGVLYDELRGAPRSRYCGGDAKGWMRNVKCQSAACAVQVTVVMRVKLQRQYAPYTTVKMSSLTSVLEVRDRAGDAGRRQRRTDSLGRWSQSGSGIGGWREPSAQASASREHPCAISLKNTNTKANFFTLPIHSILEPSPLTIPLDRIN